MQNPVNPSRSSPDPASGDGPSASSYESAVDAVRQVIAWYGEQLQAERSRPVPDENRLGQLLAERKACRADLELLEDADADVIARTGERYEARVKNLPRP